MVVNRADIELVRQLGDGGFGDVWLARHRTEGYECVVKYLREKHDPENQRRFLREAKLLEKYGNHSGVVRFYAYFEGAKPCIVMEAMQASLAACLNGPLDPQIAASIVRVIAATLAAIHKNGDLHRDIKPANILMNEDGTYKIADFGLGRGHSTINLTFGGLGTRGYIAPEVEAGHPATPAADVYSLGATLFELLTGVHPVNATKPLDPAAYVPNLPRQLLILVRAMTHTQAERRPTAAEVANRLTTYLDAPKQPVVTVPVEESPWPAIIGVAACVVIGLGLIAVLSGEGG